jgi:hypothetical protein
MQFSLFELERMAYVDTDDTDGDNTHDLINLEEGKNVAVPLTTSYAFTYLLLEDQLPMLPQFGPERELVFSLNGYELLSKINKSGSLVFQNLDVSSIDPETLLALRLYQNGDDQNVLWEYVFPNLDFPEHALTKDASDHIGHSDTETYWNLLGAKVVGLAADGSGTLKGMEPTSKGTNLQLGDIPSFVSRTEGAGNNMVTRYFMVADSAYTPLGYSSVVNADLDVYWFNENTHDYDAAGEHKTPDSILTISFPNYRAFDKKKLVFNDEVISKKAKLYIALYDLDDHVEPVAGIVDKERVGIKINGNSVEGNPTLNSVISSPDRKWQVYELEFNTSMLTFPEVNTTAGEYPIPKINTVTLELDKSDQGWALEVDWAVIQYDAISPVFLVHGASQDQYFWDGTWYQKEQIGDLDFVDALKSVNYPYYHEIDIRGDTTDDEHRDYKGGATIVIGGRQLARIIPQLCRQHGTFSYNIVAHSKGGLWSRMAWQLMHAQNAQDPTARFLTFCTFITLSTPHTGSVLADMAGALLSESLTQSLNSELTGQIVLGHLGVEGNVPMDYENIRADYWPQDWRKVIDNPHYWNMSYDDLDPNSVNDFNVGKVSVTGNVSFIASYNNEDGSTTEFYGLTTNADNDTNNRINAQDAGFHAEWYPLSVVPVLNPFNGYEYRYTLRYQFLGRESHFEYFVVNRDRIHFADRHTEPVFRPNDLYVTIESGRGGPHAGHSGSLIDIITHIPMEMWWDGKEPDATNHATVASEEAGEYAVDNCLRKLR